MTCDLGAKNIVTWDIVMSLIRHVSLKKITVRYMQYSHFFKSTCDIGDPNQEPGVSVGSLSPGIVDENQMLPAVDNPDGCLLRLRVWRWAKPAMAEQ